MDEFDRTVEGAATDRFALVGPGRAGTTIALALVAAGWTPTAVAGRAPDAVSTVEVAGALECRAALLADVARGARLVVIATPDAAITETAAQLASTLEPDTLVIHLAGSRGLDALEPLAVRDDLRLGALHPLQSFPSSAVGLERIRGSWAAVAGDPEVGEIAASLGFQEFTLSDELRARYHAAAVVASNHLVALLGQVMRIAQSADVPFEAFLPLARASLENAIRLGPQAALTGPIARGDLATVQRHLGALGPSERDAYRAMAREAVRLAEPRAPGTRRLLADLERDVDDPRPD